MRMKIVSVSILIYLLKTLRSWVDLATSFECQSKYSEIFISDLRLKRGAWGCVTRSLRKTVTKLDVQTSSANFLSG